MKPMTLARSTQCVLVDRDELSRWIFEFQANAQVRRPQVVRA
jgi:hypothetical protein